MKQRQVKLEAKFAVSEAAHRGVFCAQVLLQGGPEVLVLPALTTGHDRLLGIAASDTGCGEVCEHWLCPAGCVCSLPAVGRAGRSQLLLELLLWIPGVGWLCVCAVLSAGDSECRWPLHISVWGALCLDGV